MACWIRVLRPTELAETILGVCGKRNHCIHHVCTSLVLNFRIWHLADVLPYTVPHVEIRAVVGAAARIETQILPVAKVAVTIGRDAVADPVIGCDAPGAGEALKVEVIPLLFCKVSFGCEGG